MSISQTDIELIAQDPKLFLNQCYRTEERIHTKERQIRQLEELSVRITTTIKPVSAYIGPGDKVGDCATQIVDLTEELAAEIAGLVAGYETVREAIAFFVPDKTLQAILEDRYILGMRWEEIACEYHYAYRWVLRLHKKALICMRKNAEDYLNEKKPEKS